MINDTVACNGYGNCTEEGQYIINIYNRCKCFDGWAIGSGSNCDTCDSYHYGPNCDKCPGLLNLNVNNMAYISSCSGHGTCEGAGTTSGSGLCVCSEGWEGDICNECKTGYYGRNCVPCPNYPDICNGNGKCIGSGDVNGEGKCKCKWSYIGETCTIPSI